MEKKKEQLPLKIWVSGDAQPKGYRSSVDALKDKPTIQNATSASIEIVERVGTEGSTLTSKSNASLRNWAIRELDAIGEGNKKLSFFDVKYIPKEFSRPDSDGVVSEYPAKLVFRRSIPKSKEE